MKPDPYATDVLEQAVTVEDILILFLTDCKS